MISLEMAKEIATKEFSEYPIGEIIDIGNCWAFCYDSSEQSVPGTPIVLVKKEDGEIGYMPIPPLENLDILNNGTIIETTK